MNIAIPQYFAVYNSLAQKTGSFSSQQVYYNNTALAGHGKAGECIHCGLCEQACPQHLPIREKLKEADRELRPLPLKIGLKAVRAFIK